MALTKFNGYRPYHKRVLSVILQEIQWEDRALTPDIIAESGGFQRKTCFRAMLDLEHYGYILGRDRVPTPKAWEEMEMTPPESHAYDSLPPAVKVSGAAIESAARSYINSVYIPYEKARKIRATCSFPSAEYDRANAHCARFADNEGAIKAVLGAANLLDAFEEAAARLRAETVV